MNKIIVICFALLGSLAMTDAQAKDLDGRFGLGFQGNIASPLGGERSLGGALSGRYWLMESIAVQGTFGFATIDIETEDDDGPQADFEFTTIEFTGRCLYRALSEENMHLYVGGLGGVNITTNDETDAVGTIAVLGGAEFFLPGLPNLSLSGEAGFGVAIGENGFAISTAGNVFGGLSLHYYFGGGSSPDAPATSTTSSPDTSPQM